MDFEKHNISLIKGYIEDEDGNLHPSYGISYFRNGRTYTVRDLSTRRCDVELFIMSIINGGGSLTLIDDLVEDFIS